MGHANGVITAPVNTDDIGSVIGSASHDVATLCLDNKIMKFNKNKPYRGTSPAVADRKNDNAGTNNDNGTGKFCGNRGSGTTTGFPCYWGMRYPMNTSVQNSVKVGTNTAGTTTYLICLCYDVCNGKGNHPNYEYMKPVAGTDFFRLEDFIGYNHTATSYIESGLRGQRIGETYATMAIMYTSLTPIIAYVQLSPDSCKFELKDIIPEADKYRLVMEFYKYDTTNVWKQGSDASPFYIVRSTGSLDTTSPYIQISAKPSDILNAGHTAGLWNKNDSLEKTFIVCVGMEKIDDHGIPVGGSGFIAPWVEGKHTCATLVKIAMASGFAVALQKYSLVSTPSSESQYTEFTTSEIVISQTFIYFKTKITNNDTTALNIYKSNAPAGSHNAMFRAWAVGGGYGDPDNMTGAGGNEGHFADGGTNATGAHRNLDVGTEPDVSANVSYITIPAGASRTVYFKANNFFPKGNTTQIFIEVSTDGGNLWFNAGDTTCNFKRTN